MSSDWEVIEASDMYRTDDGVEKCVEFLYVREVQDSVEWWAIVSGGESVEVRYDEERVSLSVSDWVRNLKNLSVSVRGGVSVVFEGDVGFEFDMEDAMLVDSFDSVEDAVSSVERRIE